MDTGPEAPKGIVALIVKLTLFSVVVAACAPVEYADPDAVEAAETFTVTSGMSRIYVFRDDNVVLNTPIRISVDGETIGVTGNSTYVVTTLDPGAHVVTAEGENTAELTVTTAAGELLFIEVGVGLGVFTNRARLYQVDPETGKAAVTRARLVR